MVFGAVRHRRLISKIKQFGAPGVRAPKWTNSEKFCTCLLAYELPKGKTRVSVLPLVLGPGVDQNRVLGAKKLTELRELAPKVGNPLKKKGRYLYT